MLKKTKKANPKKGLAVSNHYPKIFDLIIPQIPLSRSRLLSQIDSWSWLINSRFRAACFYRKWKRKILYSRASDLSNHIG